jgi:hypothetical protein
LYFQLFTADSVSPSGLFNTDKDYKEYLHI